MVNLAWRLWGVCNWLHMRTQKLRAAAWSAAVRLEIARDNLRT